MNKDTKTEILKDKILKEFQDKFQVFLTQNYQNTGKILATGLIYGFIYASLDQVREQTLEEVEKEVIGEDDPEARVYENYTSNTEFVENQLRAKQREALTKLKGETTK